MAAENVIFRLLIIVCMCCFYAHAIEEDICEYFQSLKRTCNEADRLWTSNDVNLLEFIRRKLHDQLSILVYFVERCNEHEILTGLLQNLYNSLLLLYRHYSFSIERFLPEHENEFYSEVERTGQRGRPRYECFKKMSQMGTNTTTLSKKTPARPIFIYNAEGCLSDLFLYLIKNAELLVNLFNRFNASLSLF